VEITFLVGDVVLVVAVLMIVGGCPCAGFCYFVLVGVTLLDVGMDGNND
jgi:hypothetical protein